MKRIEMTQKELEKERRKYGLFGRNEEFVPIENFTREANDGNYANIGGKRIAMTTYGEKVTEDEE